MKKVFKCIGLVFLLGVNFLGIEYLSYSLLLAKSKLYPLFFIIFMALISIFASAIYKLNIANKIICGFLVILSVFLGLGLLKLILIYM